MPSSDFPNATEVDLTVIRATLRNVDRLSVLGLHNNAARQATEFADSPTGQRSGTAGEFRRIAARLTGIAEAIAAHDNAVTLLATGVRP